MRYTLSAVRRKPRRSALRAGFFAALLGFVLFLAACGGADAGAKRRVQIQIATPELAAKKLLQDTTDGFFEQMRPLEMCIQMRLPQAECEAFRALGREEMLRKYADFLRADLATVSIEQMQLLDKQMQLALKYTFEAFPKLSLPDTLTLIVVKGDTYGGTVYYTRENCIIVPLPQLFSGNEEHLMSVLVHEIFHVYSRRHADKRRTLFAEIGFEPIDSLQWSPFLAERRLCNPDAVDCRYLLRLPIAQGGADSLFVPVIYSRFAQFERDFSFFQHLHFQLFPVRPLTDSTGKPIAGAYAIAVPDVGTDPQQLEAFFERIGRNTNYIIHPEEIIADNFRMLVLQKVPTLRDAHQPADERGAQLLQKIQTIVAQ